MENEIQFQFPSNGKDFPNSQTTELGSRSNSFGFNSLQTGRTFRTVSVLLQKKRCRTVSIPFKREGLSERYKIVKSMAKLYSVSIPFKREGLSERQCKVSTRSLQCLQVSIPFKREGLSELEIVPLNK